MTTPDKPEPTPWTANSLDKPAPVCAGNETPTPWTARKVHENLESYPRWAWEDHAKEFIGYCETLERHLHRIVEAANKHGCGGPVMDAIQAAKETLSK